MAKLVTEEQVAVMLRVVVEMLTLVTVDVPMLKKKRLAFKLSGSL